MINNSLQRLLVISFVLVGALSIAAQTNESLGDAARRLRAEKAGAAQQAGSSATSQATPGTHGTDAGSPAVMTDDPPWLPRIVREIGPQGTDEPQRYLTDVQMLLMMDRFDVLEKTAEELRQAKSRFPGGGWKLRTFYLGLVQPIKGDEVPDEAWAMYFGRMKRWKAKYPDSVTAHVALANADNEYAWSARGGETSEKVNASASKLFSERTAEAKAALMAVASTKPKDPDWYRAMQDVALAQGWDRQQADELLQAAVSVEPLYHYFYESHAHYLLPQWYGKEGESEKFAERAAELAGPKAGDWIYATVAASLVCNCQGESDFTKLSWPRVQNGFLTLKQTYGWSSLRQNQFAMLAFKAGDRKLAGETFQSIGDAWEPGIWHTEELFHQAREWAWNTGAPAKELAEAQAAAEANLRTAAGKEYDQKVAAAFEARYSDAVGSCVAKETAKPAKFDLLMQIGANGLMQRIFSSPQTPVGDCMVRTLTARMLTEPPKALYWVKISMDFGE